MERRNFIRNTGISIAAILLRDSLGGLANAETTEPVSHPDEIKAVIDNVLRVLSKSSSDSWSFNSTIVRLKSSQDGTLIKVLSKGPSLSEIRLVWKTVPASSSRILNDQWERAYGDLSWHPLNYREILPWYFIEYNADQTTNGLGVKTGANAFCYWQIDGSSIALVLDTRCGATGVQLGDRELSAAEIVSRKGSKGESPFHATRMFTQLLCPKPRLPAKPIYGINDWYFSYGNNSEELILKQTRLLATLAAQNENKPFSVIDAGWFKRTQGVEEDACWGDMRIASSKFGDMGNLSQKIRDNGMRPGIWTRPICANENDPCSLLLPISNGRIYPVYPILDPSIPENLDRVSSLIKLYRNWNFDLVKFDFSSYDYFGKWGYELTTNPMTNGDWFPYDRTKTNAEIIKALYETIRRAAGDTYIISCNTFSHLSAGLFELNRIGDDVSGLHWEQTLKMGVNALGFRCTQHENFYLADGDCVGLTKNVPWEKNKQWMELLAKSGTPLFISADPDAIGPDQKQMIQECFAIASKKRAVGEPMDWMNNQYPSQWNFEGTKENFIW